MLGGAAFAMPVGHRHRCYNRGRGAGTGGPILHPPPTGTGVPKRLCRQFERGQVTGRPQASSIASASGVAPGVELGGGRDIALPPGPGHQHDLAHPAGQAWFAGECQRQVGRRADPPPALSHWRWPCAAPPDRVGGQARRGRWPWRQHNAADPVHPMHVRSGGERAQQRPVRPPPPQATARPVSPTTAQALGRVWARPALPPATVTRRTSSSGLASARNSAMASSVPGSQSMMTGRAVTPTRHPASPARSARRAARRRCRSRSSRSSSRYG